jgi:hypothetical protein
MYLATKIILFAYLASAALVSASAADRSLFHGFEALLEDDDSPSVMFWARNKRETQRRAPGDDPQTSLSRRELPITQCLC